MFASSLEDMLYMMEGHVLLLIKSVPLWLQENFEQKHDLVIEDTELKQVAYVFGCNNSTVQVKGKINSIIIGEQPENRAGNV